MHNFGHMHRLKFLIQISWACVTDIGLVAYSESVWKKPHSVNLQKGPFLTNISTVQNTLEIFYNKK